MSYDDYDVCDEVFNLDHGMDGGDPDYGYPDDYDDENWELREAYEEEADCANCDASYYVIEGKDGFCGYCVATGQAK